MEEADFRPGFPEKSTKKQINKWVVKQEPVVKNPAMEKYGHYSAGSTASLGLVYVVWGLPST